MKYEFAEPPPVGLAITADGQRYDLIGHETHIRRDGSATVLLAWASECATCGEGFTTKTTANRMPGSRRCDAHKAPGRRVRP